MAEQAAHSAGAEVHTPNGKKQRAPSSQQKRNASNRKANVPQDGTLSDGALLSSVAASPRSKKTHRTRPSVASGGNSPHQGHAQPHTTNAQKKRPVSNGSGLLPTPAKDDSLRYAGATFSASPAASNLPVPKFAARSASNATAPPQFQKSKLSESPPEVFDSSPEATPASPAPIGPNSPLEMFFRADRAEKARNGSSNGGSQQTNGGFQAQNGGHMNGTARPALGDRTHSSPGRTNFSAGSDEQSREASTRNLKSMLFSNNKNNNPTSPPRNTPPPPFAIGNQHLHKTPEAASSQSPFGSSPSGPSTPFSDQRNNASYHYGNRNLSPLFKAARDSPSRPSGLSQVLANGGGGHHHHDGQAPRMDANNFARQYLNDQITAHHHHQHQNGGNNGPSPFPGNLPPHPNSFPQQHQHGMWPNSAPSSSGLHYPPPPQQQYQLQSQPQQSQQQPQTRPADAGGLRDTSVMENDLRRILRLS